MTTTSPIRVGIIGTNPDRGWATAAHLPALAALPRFRTVAVASTRLAGARQVAQRWGADHAFDDPYDLIRCPDVDLVVICVKGPDHAPLIRTAVAEGKHLFCEWPIGIDAAESRELTELVEAAGVTSMIGMQADQAAGARFVGRLVRDGTIGTLHAASLVLLTPGIGGHEVIEAMRYTTDRGNGVNLMTTSTGHALAALAPIVGELAEVSALPSVLHRQVRVVETGELVPNDAPNDVAIIGRTRDGVPITVAIHGGTPPGAPRFTLHLIGSDGALIVTPATLGDSINVGDWLVTLARADGSVEELPVPDEETELVGPPKNIARLYAQFAGTLLHGAPPTMDFRAALRFHEVVDAIERSGHSGAMEQVRK